MWFFRNRSADAQTIRALSQERDQAEDAYTNLLQAHGAAEAAMREMQKAMTDEGVAGLARKVTAQIANIYAAGSGGVTQRDIAVHAVVATAVRKAARGEAHWNEGRLAAKAQGSG